MKTKAAAVAVDEAESSRVEWGMQKYVTEQRRSSRGSIFQSSIPGVIPW